MTFLIFSARNHRGKKCPNPTKNDSDGRALYKDYKSGPNSKITKITNMTLLQNTADLLLYLGFIHFGPKKLDFCFSLVRDPFCYYFPVPIVRPGLLFIYRTISLCSRHFLRHFLHGIAFYDRVAKYVCLEVSIFSIILMGLAKKGY